MTEPRRPFMSAAVTFYRPQEGWFNQTLRGELVAGVTDPDEQFGMTEESSPRFLGRTARVLLEKAPRLAGLRAVRQWAGVYDTTPDKRPLVGEHRGLPGFFAMCGWSGRGMLLAPLRGRAARARDRRARARRAAGAVRPGPLRGTVRCSHRAGRLLRRIHAMSRRVVIVGGGIVGCATAYFAAREGLDVTLLEQRARRLRRLGTQPWIRVAALPQPRIRARGRARRTPALPGAAATSCRSRSSSARRAA